MVRCRCAATRSPCRVTRFVYSSQPCARSFRQHVEKASDFITLPGWSDSRRSSFPIPGRPSMQSPISRVSRHGCFTRSRTPSRTTRRLLRWGKESSRQSGRKSHGLRKVRVLRRMARCFRQASKCIADAEIAGAYSSAVQIDRRSRILFTLKTRSSQKRAAHWEQFDAFRFALRADQFAS